MIGKAAMIGKFVHRYLDPSESLLEILFGLIMALTLTAGARLLPEQNSLPPLELAAALAGCNIAWGLIDAVFYLLGNVFNRGRRLQFMRRLQTSRDETEAYAIVRDEFGLAGEPPSLPEDRANLHKALVDLFRHARLERPHFIAQDYMAALLIFALVSAAALPGLVPLLLLHDSALALRLANTVQVVLLFLIGYRWATFSGTRPWRGAAIIGLLGVALVMLTVALGG